MEQFLRLSVLRLDAPHKKESPTLFIVVLLRSNSMRSENSSLSHFSLVPGSCEEVVVAQRSGRRSRKVRKKMIFRVTLARMGSRHGNTCRFVAVGSTSMRGHKGNQKLFTQFEN